MGTRWAQIASAREFLRQGVRNFDVTASLFPSSRRLVDAMLDPLPLRSAGVVIEVGFGTGTLTRELLRRMRPDARLYAIELSAELVDLMAGRTSDPRMSIVCGDACRLDELVHEAGLGPADAIVSSLGLSLMPPEAREAYMKAAVRALGPRGIYTQYAYAHARHIAYSQARREFFRFDAAHFLKESFHHVRGRLVGWNVPPAIAYTCHGARHA